MALPLRYAVRNVTVRRASALLTALGIAMTVAVFAGVLSLKAGLEQLYRPRGAVDLAIYLRPGATSEGESGMSREAAEIVIKSRPEVARDGEGRPLAAAESYLAVYMEKEGGGVTNVPLRGIQPASLAILGGDLRLREGRMLEFGTDEVVVGAPLTRRMKNARVGDTLWLNVTPFKVVGVFETSGAQGGEVWGDVDRMMDALDRRFFQRVVARVVSGTDFAAVNAELKSDPRTALEARSERAYLSTQTSALGTTLRVLAGFLTVVMGAAAVLGAMNTMLASVAARNHEIGVLLAIGFPPLAVSLAFVLEAAVIGLLGGALGVLLVLPFHGRETGAMNWNTFTDVSFAFRLTPSLLVVAVGLAVLLGVLGGALPAWRASRMRPVEALRQH